MIRFLVGIRAVILVLLGCTDIKLARFVVFNAVNSILWSVLVTLIGYLFGNMVYVFVSDMNRYQNYIIPITLVAVTILIVVYRHIMQEKEKSYGDE
jgi:membrane protein DedA with SNARE-associated domain